MEIAEDIPITTLSTHYTVQLEQAGWMRLAEGQDGSTAWHSWTFRDQNNEQWHAFFFLALMPGTEHRYFLYLKTYWTGNSETKSD